MTEKEKRDRFYKKLFLVLWPIFTIVAWSPCFQIIVEGFPKLTQSELAPVYLYTTLLAVFAGASNSALLMCLCQLIGATGRWLRR